MYNFNYVIGKDDAAIDYTSLQVPVHRDIVEPFVVLRDKARRAGFELAIASGYRSFERQLSIWNNKACGVRPVFDDGGELLEMARLTPWQQAQAILRWSALPGTSRHHWGTDIDVYDSAAVEPGYAVQLSVEEVAAGGPFAKLHDWLDEQIATGAAEGFFRPYDRDRGGTAPERWHLSYGPLAKDLQSGLAVDALGEVLQRESLQLKRTVMDHLEEIIERYVVVPDALYKLAGA